MTEANLFVEGYNAAIAATRRFAPNSHAADTLPPAEDMISSFPISLHTADYWWQSGWDVAARLMMRKMELEDVMG